MRCVAWMRAMCRLCSFRKPLRSASARRAVSASSGGPLFAAVAAAAAAGVVGVADVPLPLFGTKDALRRPLPPPPALRIDTPAEESPPPALVRSAEGTNGCGTVAAFVTPPPPPATIRLTEALSGAAAPIAVEVAKERPASIASSSSSADTIVLPPPPRPLLPPSAVPASPRSRTPNAFASRTSSRRPASSRAAFAIKASPIASRDGSRQGRAIKSSQKRSHGRFASSKRKRPRNSKTRRPSYCSVAATNRNKQSRSRASIRGHVRDSS